jgi:L-amino acid N-acyltransferase YncA
MTYHDSVDALTADGAIVRIRSVTAADAQALADLYHRASAESLRMRFFAPPGEHVIATEVTRLTRAPSGDHSAILAERAGVVVGVASWERPSDVDRRAEFAVFVDEELHGRGVGTLLLEHLASRARGYGVRELVGEVLPGNAAMLRVATDLSSRVFSRFADGIVDVGLATASDDGATIDRRRRRWPLARGNRPRDPARAGGVRLHRRPARGQPARGLRGGCAGVPFPARRARPSGPGGDRGDLRGRRGRRRAGRGHSFVRLRRGR